MKKMSIICIGEILWDSVPLGLFLGGAPFNVAYHLNKLGAGDAFLAALITGYLNQRSMKESLLLANRLAAFVATCYGGTPHYTLQEIIESEALLNY